MMLKKKKLSTLMLIMITFAFSMATTNNVPNTAMETTTAQAKAKYKTKKVCVQYDHIVYNGKGHNVNKVYKKVKYRKYVKVASKKYGAPISVSGGYMYTVHVKWKVK